MPLRILQVVPSFHPAVSFGGPIVSLYALCNHLAALPGVQLRVVTTDTSGPRRADRLSLREQQHGAFPGYRVEFHRKLLGRDLSLTLLLRLWSNVAWADVVHLTAVYSIPTIPVLLAARILGKPVVWSPRGALQRWKDVRRVAVKGVWDTICNLLLDPKRSVLHVTSQQEAEESAHRIRNATMVLIQNGVDTPASLPAREWRPGGQMRLLYLGRLDPIKGIDNLLKAMAEMRDDTVRLRICGTGAPEYAQYLADLCRQLGIERNVEFVGAVLGATKTVEFLRADVCVVPSHSENFGMVVAEALAHGTPVIASRGTPWKDIESQGAGFWVANDPHALSKAISRAQQSDLGAMGEAGKNWMQRSYSWHPIAARMLDVYRQLVGTREAAR
jgi:glycosyltransferase involved in cell wall biosynthesis